MKRLLQQLLCGIPLAMTAVISLTGPALSANTCSSGLAEPPFLSYGVNSNLLMLIDNSGSMLDMGYIDTDTDGAGADKATQCFDESFVTYDSTATYPSIYAGNFKAVDEDKNEYWYKWVQNTPSWDHVAYTAGDIVYYDGTFFRALNDGTSNGDTIYKDQNVEWEMLMRPAWDPNKTYHAESFVFDIYRGIVMYTETGGGPPTPTPTSYLNDDPRFMAPNGYRVRTWAPGKVYAAGEYVLSDDLVLYYAKTTGTSSLTSTAITNDDSIEWELADYMGWRAGISYDTGDIATHNGMIFRCTTAHVAANVADIYADNYSANWERLDEGYFVEVSSKVAALSDCKNVATPAHLNSTDNENYASNDACVVVNNDGTDPQQVLIFAASGNLLNWASASKFDIQKNILTGGKYDPVAERIIGESRGCAGKSFIKQVPINQVAGDGTTTAMQMTMKIRPGDITDRVDSTDDTTRLEIYAITQNGLDFDACQSAIDYFADPNGVAQVEQNTALCVGFSGTGTVPVEHVVYHKAMQACWYLSKQGSWKGGNDHMLVADNCEDIYLGNTLSGEKTFPANISIDESTYICYGIYDGTIGDTSREGYIGRCWKPGDYTADPADPCQQIQCGYGTGDWDGDGSVDPVPNCTNSNGSGLPCYFDGPDGSKWRCASDGYIDSCSGNFSSGAEKCTSSWTDIYRDNVGDYNGTSCTPTVVQEIGYWEADYLGDNDETLDGNLNTAGTETYNLGQCVDQALRDYCSGLGFPEVIDPSDQASSTEEAWNLPGILVDAAIVGQLGEQPLLTTKSYIYPTDPFSGTLTTPQGILQDKAQELRIGAMAFNTNGAAAECILKPDTPPVNRYCPADNSNKDGAQIITPIKLGSLVTDQATSRHHVDDLVTAINEVRAVSWTPLAEAVYNAVGYYTQNTAVRLDDTDFQVYSEVGDWARAKEYGKGFYVIDQTQSQPKVYQTIFGGRSTDDLTATSPLDDIGEDSPDWIEVGDYRGAWSEGTTYNSRDIVLHDGKHYITYTDTPLTSKLKPGASAVSKSGPLYDEGVPWEPLVDPIAKWCQDNNILIITEGASTADLNQDVSDFLEANPLNSSKPIVDGLETGADPITSPGQCTNGLQGSTYLDDMTYFAKDPDDLYELYPTVNSTLPEGDYPFDPVSKKNINTHIVVAGTLRDINVGTDPAECNPREIMYDAADNGGTDAPVESNNPAQLKKNLEEIFNAFRQRASAGSAASVISSARGGEGAIYQAIFWPELARISGTEDYGVEWAGDVHGLFLDNRGFMYEDTNGDRKLTVYEDIDGDCGECPSASPVTPRDDNTNPTGTCDMDIQEARGEDIDGDGNYDCLFEDLDHDGHLDNIPEADPDGDGIVAPEDDLDGDGHLDDVNEDLDGDGYLDTGEDTNHNGVLDDGEDINRNGILDPGDIDGDGLPEPSEDLDGDGNCNNPWGGDGIAGTSDDNFDPFVDVDGDGHRDVDEDVNNNGLIDCAPDGDRRVIIYFDQNTRRSMACYDTSVLGADKTCDNPVELQDVKYIWSAAEWLGSISAPNLETFPNVNDPNILQNRTTYDDATENRRYIFTWNDLDNDGIVPDGDTIDSSGEILKFESSIDWDSLSVDASRGSASNDFDLPSDTEVDMIINWLRGEDWPFNESVDGDIDGDGLILRNTPLRSRLLPDPGSPSGFITWRLGDIIHSTPMTVAAPQEGYHLIYNDFTYAQFLNKYKERRHVVYFGSNDGMLHAVNAGFYNENEKKFCLTPDKDADGNCTDAESDSGNGIQSPHEVGKELWAYVPYNLLPHLKCLADEGYNHKYFVDQRPRIFDAQIFDEEISCRNAGGTNFDHPDCIHPNGWGTILVNGMRFGGAPVDADQFTGHAAGDDDRHFASSWFIMDITDPENEPTLLGEMTFKNDDSTIDLGYTTMIPTMVIMKGTTETHWYLVLGSGPFDGDAADGAVSATLINPLKGISDVNAKIGILPLDRLVTRNSITNSSGAQIVQSSTKSAVRLPSVDQTDPTAAVVEADGAATFPLDTPSGGFVSDLVTVDYDINPSYEEYKSDVVYFGTVEGNFSTMADGRTYWDGGGKLYRLVTKDTTYPLEPSSLGLSGSPYGRGTTEALSAPGDWTIKPLIDLTAEKQPITAAPSVGTDGHNFWVFFGTGRFYDADDKTDDTQHSYYGIKEPALIAQNASGQTTRFFTWDEVESRLARPSFTTNFNYPGNKGLVDVTDIQVALSPKIHNAALSCNGGGTACIPGSIDPNLKDLEDFIGGTGLDNYATGVKTGPSPADDPCTLNGCADGWVRDFTDERERNVGQATLLGGLVTFTTYQPFNDVCQAEGNAFLYADYYRTGTAWHKNIFGLPEGMNGDNVSDKLNLGRGLATTPNLHVGSGQGVDDDSGPKAFVQTSTGEILEIEQENLPIKNYRTGRSKWKEYIP